ncbi:MAG TPA: asparaginase [Gaiellaceae bacterium]|nr:asparaginase [Gaiellaceae bacterium]
MAEPIRVTVLRGETVESAHRVHAVAVQEGELVASAGDPDLVTFMRSAAKPIQAMPVARAREDLDDRDLAIASASHLADDEQLAAVRGLLAKAPAAEDDLECGPFEGSKLKHNCSGKHAGMLALCRAEGWPTEGYRLPGHPCQQAALAEVGRLAGTDEIATATDGCGVVTFALSLTRISIAFSRVDGRVADAMRAYPALIRGPRALDTNLMQAFPGWIAKGGAEGLLCAASLDGLSLVLKVEDGAQRALRPALGSFLNELGLDGSLFGPTPVGNSRDEVVGDVRAS